MSAEDLLALLPLMLLIAGGVTALLVGSFVPKHGWMVALVSGGCLAAIGAVFWLAPIAPHQVAGMIALDRHSRFFWFLLLGATVVTAGFAHGYLWRRPVRGEHHHREFYVLLAFATAGAVVLASALHFAALFIGLELLSLCLFGLFTYQAQNPRALEAGMKYLVLSALGSGVLLFGLALLYVVAGTLSIEGLREYTSGAPHLYVEAGVVLVLVGIGFKLSLVPFHMWTPDIYEGASAPVSAFVAAVSKVAVLAWLLRFLDASGAGQMAHVQFALALLAAASMLVGNLLALRQDNIKRMLAYSSISHLGYLAIPLIAGAPLANEAVMFYSVAYVITMLAAFGVVAVVSGQSAGEEIVHISAYEGLFRRRPLVAAALAGVLFSLAGIPVSVGFMAKFYVFAAGVNAALWWLLAVLVISSAVGLFFYLRLLTALFTHPSGERETHRATLGTSILAVLLAAIVLLGLLPAPLVDVVR